MNYISSSGELPHEASSCMARGTDHETNKARREFEAQCQTQMRGQWTYGLTLLVARCRLWHSGRVRNEDSNAPQIKDKRNKERR